MNIYTERPPLFSTEKQLSGWLTSIHLDPRKLTSLEREENDIEDTIDENGDVEHQEAWTAHDVFYRHSKPLTENDYPKLVSAIVRSKYSADDVEAIQLNLLDNRSNEHENEMTALQAWREQAKAVARQIVNNN